MLTDYLLAMASATAMGLLAIALSTIVLLAVWQATGWAIAEFFTKAPTPAAKPSSRI